MAEKTTTTRLPVEPFKENGNTLSHALPNYADRLDALHKALANDFRAIVNRIPILPAQLVVDVGCGDGFFTTLLAEKPVRVFGLDNSDAYLERARTIAQHQKNVEFLPGDAKKLPFADGSIDVVWSAHSMHSYPDVHHCLREFRRVLQPGGILAVLESDNIHSVMLSWAPDLELAVRQAEHEVIGDEDSYIGTYFPRFAVRLLGEAGFQSVTREYVLINRFGLASEPLTQFVKLYLENVLARTTDRLSDKLRSRLAQLADPQSEKFLPRQKTFVFGSLQVLTLAHATDCARIHAATAEELTPKTA